ncbi:interleukin 2 receptor, gamma b [Clupea harengus]|uniref:Interleukin 2 receptor, gamma b n=1 Tax=Clupea harengus TaxID=7950 RepID=A0A6P8EDC5_CLUHA|nr:interleukin 2 receptor, gamma b [Clupea harengus]
MIPSKSFSVLCLVLFCVMGCSTSIPSIYCYSVNLENVNCTWNCIHSGGNFTFRSKFEGETHSGCPAYQYKDGCSVGCIFPSIQNRFTSLYTTLSNGTALRNQTHDIRNDVKLHPPQNLTALGNSSVGDISLQWNFSKPALEKCVESNVAYRKDSGEWQSSSVLLPGSTSYTLAKVSQTQTYIFRVRCRIASQCAESKLWSDWSTAVSWGPLKPSASAETPVRNVLLMVFGVVTLAIILVIMVRVLLECERIKVIFVPVVPDPTRKLNDLFYEFGGNVEGWVRISPELREAFEPDFTEATCAVRESKPTV